MNPTKQGLKQSSLAKGKVGYNSLSPWIQQNKDWNWRYPQNCYPRYCVLAHESNKTRIETFPGWFSGPACGWVLAHESNKTRIETTGPRPVSLSRPVRLSPWIQQNKDWNTCSMSTPNIVVLCLSPWIQQNKDWNDKLTKNGTLKYGSLSPWIQQNKDWNSRRPCRLCSLFPQVLAHESNKTRIETYSAACGFHHSARCLSPWIQQNKDWNSQVQLRNCFPCSGLSPWIQQNKDWNQATEDTIRQWLVS